MFNHVKLDKVVPRLQQLNENGVRHYLTPEGNKYPSITTVLSEYYRKAIQDWRQRVGAEEAGKISGKASTRGTKLHKACEDYINNLVPVFQTPYERDLFKRFSSTLQRIDKVYAQEIRMYSDHLRIAGTVDCVGEFDGVLSVIDFKTSAKEKDKKYIENYFMQCSAYAIMFEEQFGIPVSQTVVAIAVEDGESQVFVEKRDTHVKRLIHFRDLHERKSSLVTH